MTTGKQINRSVYISGTAVRMFLAVVLVSGLGHGLYHGMQDNYLAQIVGITEFERGVVEFFRELPGLLLVFILAAMHFLTQVKVFRVGLAIMLVGAVGLLVSGPSKPLVMSVMVVYSLGDHITMPVKSSLSLSLAQHGKAGASLGMTSAVSQAGRIIGFLVVSGLFALMGSLGKEPLVSYHVLLVLSSLLLAASAVMALAIPDTQTTVKQPRLHFRKKFTTYYILEAFYGARKQIFLTFAPYVLILHYGADASIIALLLAVSAVFGMVFSPSIGTLVDRLGYKTIMVADTIILVVVCFFYGYSHLLFSMDVAFIVVCINFVLDTVVSLASMAASVYVQDLSESQEEIRATLTTGISVNHLLSVLIALLGGLIWRTLGIEMLFAFSGALGLANSLFAATIKVPHQKQPAL